MMCYRKYLISGICLIGGLVWSVTTACAETLYLKSGQTLSGEIVEENSGYLVLKIAGDLEIVVSRRRIDRIGDADAVATPRTVPGPRRLSRPDPEASVSDAGSDEKKIFDQLIIARQEMEIYLKTYMNVLDQACATRNQSVIMDVLLEGIRYFEYVQNDVASFDRVDAFDPLREMMMDYLEGLIRMQSLVLRTLTSNDPDLQREIEEADQNLAQAVRRLDQEIDRLSRDLALPAYGTDILDEENVVIDRLRQQRDHYLELIQETRQQLQETESLGDRTQELMTSQESVRKEVKDFLDQEPAWDLQRSRKEYQYYLEAL